MDKKTTQMLKGIAILMMLFHHFCGTTLFPDITPFWMSVGADFKICVAIYAFLSGYGYYFAKEKTVQYGLMKVWRLLQIYWISLFMLFIPVALLGGRPTLWNMIDQLFALEHPLNWFAWYVFFYVFCMLVMPFVYKYLQFSLSVNLGIAMIVPYIFEAVLHSVPNYDSITLVHDLFSCFLYFPCFLVGFLLAKHRGYEKAYQIKWLRNPILNVMGIVAVFAMRWWKASIAGFLLDVFYVPIFILFASNLLEIIKKCRPVEHIFCILGKYSTGMWFFHAVFFSTYICVVFRPILLIVKQPILMYVWLVVLSLVGAMLFQCLLNGTHFFVERVRGEKA